MGNLPSLLFILLALFVGFIAGRAVKVLLQRLRYAAFWLEQNKAEPKKNAVKLVVLGDSLMQGIGASQPQKGLAGLISEYVSHQTNRPVSVINLSTSGAKIKNVLEEQIPRADITSADLVVLTVSANDATKQTPTNEYKQQIEELTVMLPPEKTVMADVPGVRHRDTYQPILQATLEHAGIRRADPVKSFANAKGGVTAGDFFHPNNNGYRYWFGAFKPEIDSLLPQLKSKAS